MPHSFYNIVHLTGLVMAFVALGGLTLHGIAGGGRDFPGKKLAMSTHGAGLLLALVGGFGMHAKIGSPWAGWLVVKLALWLVIGGAAALAVRKPSKGLWWGLVAVFAAGAWLAIAKPF